ncbi:MAG: WecB/TagA/CpsF family glycosyltransferase [Thermomicrobiales bacterium]|nr:WecB/TagA/CpsF family glycosyltransferase [Thermomicrobiales bacterium]
MASPAVVAEEVAVAAEAAASDDRVIAESRPTVLGTGVTSGTRTEMPSDITAHLMHGDTLLHIATANPEYVMFARSDPAFAEALTGSEIVTVDGAGLALAMRMLHPAVTIERFTGVMLTHDLADISADIEAGMFLLGAGPGIAEQAGAILVQQHPGAVIAGTWDDGTPRAEHDAESHARIRASGATILLVAYGAPAQIHWIHRNRAALEDAGVRVVVGIGGAFDYISGNVPWAPSLVRKLGLEWLYRLAREPWRWRRQLVLPQFVMLILIEFIRTKGDLPRNAR